MIQQRSGRLRLISFRGVTLLLLFLFAGLFSLPLASGEDPQKEVPAAEPSDPLVPNPAVPDVKLLQGLLRDWFAPKGNGRRPNPANPLAPGKPGDGEPSAESSTTRDPIDSRAPHDVKIEQLLAAAESAVKRKNGKLALELFQRLLDQPEDSLHRSADGTWQSIRRIANQQLGQLPEAILAEYRSQYGGLAQQQLLVARRTGQTADFVNVATRFFHTPAGYEAANYVGLMHFDRSEFGLAARWFDELAASPAAITRQDAWLMQAALASARSGDIKQGTRLLDRLSQGQQTVVMLGAGPVKASEWLSQSAGEPSVRAIGLSDWTQLYGSAARVGTALGGDPILIPNWFLPLTSSNTVRNALKWLIQDLHDQQRSLIMASVPLVVDGKVIYRDLRGIRSVEIERGSPLWEGIEGVSPERILGGLPAQQFAPMNPFQFRNIRVQNGGEYQGLSAEYSPLASLLFRDGEYGLISSDGKQVFVIEDHGILSANQPGQNWGWDGNVEAQDPFGMPWRTNRLVSYDLKTGRPAWSLGGGESRESFDLPLAGSYFYGTPAIEGNELFLVAGKGDDIRLWALDRLTGAPRWSQLIAYADTKIEADIGRRWLTSQVAVGNGLVVCPTTVGWLVAIDRLRQSVVWAHRYSAVATEPQPGREAGSQLVPQRELSSVWSPSAPVIAGNSIVFTPQEEPLLLCLSAIDGHRIWSQPKERGLYLAGVFEQRVLVVGETNVTSYRLSDGEMIWVNALEEGVRPSGRGVMVGSCYYLPLSNGELQSIDLETGKQLAQTFVAPQQSALGNLAMHRGKLVSLSPQGMTVFGQRDALLVEIQKRLAVNPLDPWGLLRSSEIQLLNHQYAEALPLLRKIPGDQLTPEEQIRLHAALIESLSTLIRTDVAQHAAELDELQRLATSPAEKMLYHELAAEKLLAEQKPLAAFETLCALADEVNETPFSRPENRIIQTRPIVWLSGRIRDLWTATPATERPALDARITEMTREASGKSLEACQRIIRLFSFHPAANQARVRLVEWLVEAGDPGRARLVLQQLIEQPDRNTAAHAIERLARLMIMSQRPADAVYYYEQLASRYADVVIREGVTGAKLVADLREAKELDFTLTEQPSLWPTTPLKLVQSTMNYLQPPQNIPIETSLPFFQRRSIDAAPNEQRLTMEMIESGELDWMVPLRSTVRGTDENQMCIKSIGHQLFFINRGVLHAISPLEKRNLWTKSLGDQGEGSVRHSARPVVTTMLAPVPNDGAQSLLLQRAHLTGSMAIVQPNYLCIYGRRSLSVLDPQTGEELWGLESLPMNSLVVGNHEALFVTHPGKEEASVYRALDGKRLEIPGVGNLLNHALLVRESSFLLLETNDQNPLKAIGIRRAKVVLRLHDPIAKSTTWQLELPPGTVVSPLGTEEIVAFQTDGQLQRIEVATGRTISMESIKIRKIGQYRERYLLADEDRIYLIINASDNGPQSYGESLPSIRMNGTVFAWGRKDNRLQWQQEVKHQNLVVDRFSTLPVLLCVSRSWKQRGVGNFNVGTLNLTVIHKQTGQLQMDVKILSQYSGFHAISLNSQEPYIDLKSYNMRMRLVPTVTPPPVAAAAGAPPTVPVENH